jgi:tripartite-type tricarboxylate transporter receptor subunit TctC
VLATTNTNGSKNLPGVPPVAQTLEGFDLTSWNGILGPAGLPRTIVDKLNTEILAVLADKGVQEQLLQVGFEVWPSNSPDEFAKYMNEQLNHWGSLAKQAGIQPE